MRSWPGWLAAVLLIASITLAVTLPATWLAALVEQQTGGRLSLGDATGTVWRGSAVLGVVNAGGQVRAPLLPLLPGRFHWRLSPAILIGRVELRLENSDALSQPVHLRGSTTRWQLSSSSLALSADRLSALGAPLNTVQPSGRMQLFWEPLSLSRSPDGLMIHGHLRLEMTEIASALSPVKPLGAYQLQVDWRGKRAPLRLKTLSGPLHLQGDGVLANGRLQFSGQAWAGEGQEQRLAILLNLLGQRRQAGNRNIIALEFK